MIYRVKFLSAWSSLLMWLSLSTLLALEVMTPQKRKTKARLLWWMVSLTCLISLLSIVHISEQGRYDIYTIRLKAIERVPLIYFSISDSRPKANELFWNFDSFLIIPVIFILIRYPSQSIASETQTGMLILLRSELCRTIIINLIPNCRHAAQCLCPTFGKRTVAFQFSKVS